MACSSRSVEKSSASVVPKCSDTRDCHTAEFLIRLFLSQIDRGALDDAVAVHEATKASEMARERAMGEFLVHAQETMIGIYNKASCRMTGRPMYGCIG